ncbi:substrate-binding periplasmic protein [Pseudoalteromonas sp. SSM20]|uniref:substrate-binding periplasmic protein n=1 Tax=Pseudoalteromonas sp. SSM20 TaxID=3139394 RepID=UPI003BA9E957
MIRLISLVCFLLSSSVAASDVKVAAGNFVPYFKADIQTNKQGLYELLVTSALSKMLINPTFVNVSNEAIKRYYHKGRVDIAINWTGEFLGEGYISEYRLFFYNRAILRRSSRWAAATQILELEGARIASFSGASLNFGANYNLLINKVNTRYFESGDQLAINKMLLANKVDILIADWLKFYRYIKPLGLLDEFTFLDVLHNSGSKIIFKDKQLRDEFDRVIESMHASGELEQLTQAWLAKNNLPKVSHHFLAKRS